METALTVASERFANVGLLLLSERASAQLLHFHRQVGSLDKMAKEYGRLGAMFRNAQDSGTSIGLAMGTFYWVQYAGEG